GKDIVFTTAPSCRHLGIIDSALEPPTARTILGFHLSFSLVNLRESHCVPSLFSTTSQCILPSSSGEATTIEAESLVGETSTAKYNCLPGCDSLSARVSNNPSGNTPALKSTSAHRPKRSLAYISADIDSASSRTVRSEILIPRAGFVL